ncbi:uncharacterized protein LOC124370109 isoform X2 [Homalodisca vitripennis]|uniref:uncharacterized protein LOC124370109 isoform X2 n=1 Tax=Homalodisca vitripennis TaxID=197043 RepID=UPI001EEAC37F|nr:uncharacterized protein LOC124370109 isoform X2 [Homalodisca vitripennis]
MASASSTSARSLFGESKSRLADRVQVNVNNIASVARQIQRGSKSSENIKKLQLIASHLAYQQESIARSCSMIEEVKEQAQAMQR